MIGRPPLPDVFISYSRRDSETFVERLAAALENAGLDVWVDLEDIPAASDWERDLREGVLGSETMCFVLSPGAVESAHCQNELGEAEARNKRLLPILHRPVAEDEVPQSLRRINWIPQRGSFEDDFEGSVQTLVEAIRTDLEALRAHTRWEQRASTWDERGRDASLLARGTDMREAEDWLAAQAGREPAPTALQVEYVNASRRSSSRRQRIVLGASLTALAVAVILGVLALVQRNEARDQRDLARSNELASAALANLEIDPELSLILATEAYDLNPTDRAEQALAQAINVSRVRASARPAEGTMVAADLSDDGSRFAIGGTAGTEIYDARTGERQRTLETGAVVDLDIDPDSRQVATAGEDDRLRSFALADGRPLGDLGISGKPTAVSTSYGNVTVLAVGTARGKIRVHSAGKGWIETFLAHEGPISDVAFGGGSFLASGGYDGAARVWNARSGTLYRTIKPPGEVVLDVDLSPSGRYLATVGSDGVARLWETLTGDAVGEPLNDVVFGGFVSSVSFSSAGEAVLLGRDDGTAEVISLETRALLGIFRGHSGEVQGDFGNGDRELITTGTDDTARVWDLTELQNHWGQPGKALVVDADVARQAPRVAIALTDGTAIVRDLPSGKAVAAWTAARVRLAGIAMSADGSRVATGSEEIRVWEVAATGDPVFEQPGSFIGLAISPAGDRVVGVTERGLREWDVESGATLIEKKTPESESLSFTPAFSPDGGRLAFGREVVDIVDPADGARLAEVEPSQAVLAAAFDPEGRRLVTGGSEGAVEVWDAASGERVAELKGLSSRVFNVAFSTDGRYVETLSQEGLRVWDPASELPLATLPINGVDAEPVGTDAVLAVLPESDVLELWGCEICGLAPDELRTLAEERITREPTAAEVQEFGLG